MEINNKTSRILFSDSLIQVQIYKGKVSCIPVIWRYRRLSGLFRRISGNGIRLNLGEPAEPAGPGSSRKAE